MYLIRQHVTTLTLLLPTVVGASSDGESEFAFNIFTDLAPLLALFGEQFARQFISESLTWLDHIIFAMAPLGIITAIVGAIRVSGPSWARAFIGRARESRAAAEIELMSSTSREVCEVFNGKGIVRAMGTPELTQFLLFPSDYQLDDSCGIHTLETAYDSPGSLLQRGDLGISTKWDSPMGQQQLSTDGKIPISMSETNETPITRRRRTWARFKEKMSDPEKGSLPEQSMISDKSTLDSDIAVSESKTDLSFGTRFPELKGSAPNLQLNLPTSITSHDKPVAELWYAATAATIIQIVIVVVCTVTTFHPSTRQAVGFPQSRYGFYLFMSGTLCLNLGMLLCSWVIERSTREHLWRKTPTTHRSDHYHGNGNSKIELLVAPNTPGRPESLPEQFSSAQMAESPTDIHVPPQHIATLKSNLPETGSEATSSPTPRSLDKVNLFWLQQKHTVNDQDFDPFLILGGWKEEILTSSRIRHNTSVPLRLTRIAANKFELVTICAALLGLAGFILQFEGLRGLAWPTAVTQLLAIFIMAFIRALIRRRLGEPLSTIPASEGHELDWLALRLVYIPGALDPPPPYEYSDFAKPTILWELMTPSTKVHDNTENISDMARDSKSQNNNNSSSQSQTRLLVREGQIASIEEKEKESPDRISSFYDSPPNNHSMNLFPSSSQMALKVRRRLGELTHCPGAASKEAIALAQAISLVLTELQPIRGETTQTFTWYLETNTSISTITQDPTAGTGINVTSRGKNPTTGNSSQEEPVSDSEKNIITLQAYGNKNGWRVHAPDMDAILSLWMSSFANIPTIAVPEDYPSQPDWLTKMASATVKYRRILGENPCQYGPNSRRVSQSSTHHHSDVASIHTDILTRDLNWWTNDPRIAALSIRNHGGSEARREPLEKPSTGTISLDIGFHGLQANSSIAKPQVDATQPYVHAATSNAAGDSKSSGIPPVHTIHDIGETVYIVSSSPLANALAHHIFSAFMWAISKLIPSNTFEQVTVEDSELFDSSDFTCTWGAPTLRNKKMMKIAREIEAFGLGTVEDVLLGIIPPFSARGILPNEVMMSVFLKKTKEYEALHDWDQAKDAYVNLLRLDLDPRRDDRIAYEVVVELIEFLFFVREAVDDRYGPKDSQDISVNRQARSLEAAVETISAKLKSHDLLFNVALRLRWFFIRQSRDKKFDKLFRTFQHEQNEALSDPATGEHGLSHITRYNEPVNSFNTARDFETNDPEQTLLELVKFSPYHRYSSRRPSEFDKSTKATEDFSEEGKKLVARADIFGWYPLHYATVGEDDATFDEVLRISQKRSSHHDLKNKAGRTPLHYAAMYRSGRIKKLVYGQEIARSAARVQGRDDSLPIHCAAREGNIDSINRLIPYSDIAAPDAFGRTPLHLGVINGHEEVVQSFLDNDHNCNLALVQSADELSRRTPLHFALMYNHISIITQLMSREQDLRAIAIPDLEDVTPISLVLDDRDGEFFSHLLKVFPNPNWESSTADTPHSAAGCFMSILKHAVCGKRRDILEILIKHIIIRQWEEEIILEAFSIAYREKHMDMLLNMLNIVDALFPDNILSDVATLQGHILDTGKVGTVIEEQVTTLRLEPAANKSISDLAGNERHDTDGLGLPNHTSNLPIPDKVRKYLKIDLKLNESTVLIWAIQNGNAAFIKRLINEGLIEKRSDKVNWNEQDSGNRSPLAWLAKIKPQKDSKSDGLTMKKRENALNFIWNKWNLDQKRAALNERQGRYKKTPLMYAVKNNLESIVKLFISAGASVREFDEHGMSALAYALRGQNRTMWAMLVEHDPGVVNEIRGYYNSTPLISAVRSRRADIIEFLSTCREIDPNIGDNDGDNALSWCLFNTNSQMVDIVIDKFPTINPHQMNVRGLSPLLRAYISCRDERGDTDKHKLSKLLSASCTDLRGYEISLILLDSISKKDIEIVEMLFGSGVDPRATDDAGRSLIVLASLLGSVELVDFIRKRTGSSKSAKLRLKLAMHACVQRYEDDGESIMNALQLKRVNPHSWDNSNWSVLECASRSGNEKMERKLKGMAHSQSSPRKRKKPPSSWAVSSNNPFLFSERVGGSGRCNLELKAPFPEGLLETNDAWLLIRADHCIPIFHSSYYWEVKVAKSPGNDPIVIGICAERSNINAMPGWPSSAAYGYHSNNGKVFTGGGNTTGVYETGVCYGEGDTVGCCINLEDRLLFFTRKGKKIGQVVKLRDDLRGQLYPCVGLQAGPSASGTIIQANFGGASALDFLFKDVPDSIASSNVR